MSSVINISNEVIHETIDTEKENNKDDQAHNKKIIMKESIKRSCIKSITWRFLATLTTISISYFYLNDMSVSAKIGVIDSSIKFCIHYMHERAYSRIKWGYIEKEVDIEKVDS